MCGAGTPRQHLSPVSVMVHQTPRVHKTPDSIVLSGRVLQFLTGIRACLLLGASIPSISSVSVPAPFIGNLLSLQHSLLIMFWLKYLRYFIACSLSANEVLSSPQLEGSTNPDVELGQEIYLNTPSSSQGSSLASQPDPKTPSDSPFNEITNGLHLPEIFSLNSQQNPASYLVTEPNYPPASQDSAFAPFDENEGLTNVIPSLPSFPQLNNLFPQGNYPDPKVPPDTQTDATERKKPDCNDGKFAFCCQQGPPTRGANIKGVPPEELRKRERERKSRLRKCRNC